MRSIVGKSCSNEKAIEQEETRLRLKKEQLEMYTELAASDAKLRAYEEFEDAHSLWMVFLSHLQDPELNSWHVDKKSMLILYPTYRF